MKKPAYKWIALSVTTIGSLLCGAAPSDNFLIAARVVQEVGGAMLTANSMAIITEAFPAEQRGQAMGFNAVTWGAGSVLGPGARTAALSLPALQPRPLKRRQRNSARPTQRMGRSEH
ncbi:MAG: MFS transporter [Chloroflexota bacterium]|nr:MFS transporter [Chloroflexota bacterium]